MVYNKNMSVNFTDQIFGVLADGKEVHLYTVSHGNLTFSATNYGACLTSLIVPDKNNRKDDIIVGHATLQGYISNWMCHGAIVGRYAKENPASGNVMNKLGFKYEKDIPYECNDGAVKREGIQCRIIL